MRNLLWVLPFIAFILGYQLLNQIYRVEKIANPQLVGKTLSEALKICSALKLNLRILGEQIDPDLPADTILTQKPQYCWLKPNQVIFVVIAKKPPIPITPQLVGLTAAEIGAQLVNDHKLKAKIYHLPNMAPQGTCFGQHPAPNLPLDVPKLILYLSAGNQRWVIMPKFVDLQLAPVQNFMANYPHIKLVIKKMVYPELVPNLVLAQKPAAGTIIDLTKLTQIELGISSQCS